MEIRLASPVLQSDSIVDGEGIRAVLWTQGCLHKCPGCHNPQTHSFDDGFLVDIREIEDQIDELEGQDGITFSGGDPLYQVDACLELAKYIKHNYNLKVAIYSGRNDVEYDFYEVFDYVKVGEYKKEFGPLNSPTTNQRLYRMTEKGKEDITYLFWK